MRASGIITRLCLCVCPFSCISVPVCVFIQLHAMPCGDGRYAVVIVQHACCTSCLVKTRVWIHACQLQRAVWHVLHCPLSTRSGQPRCKPLYPSHIAVYPGDPGEDPKSCPRICIDTHQRSATALSKLLHTTTQTHAGCAQNMTKPAPRPH